MHGSLKFHNQIKQFMKGMQYYSHFKSNVRPEW